MEDCIVINFCTEDKFLSFHEESSYLVEDLCIQAAQYIGIGPVARHLFGLWYPTEKVWLAPCRRLNVTKDKKWHLNFRLRFKTPTAERLKDQTDPQTFNYYFHQVRNDFLAGNIPELLQRNLRSSALGLVAADIIRFMLEHKQSPDTVKYNNKDFLPQELKRSPIWDNFLKDPLQKAVKQGWVNSRQNPDYVKEMYLREFYNLVPEYGAETFAALVDDSGKVYEVILSVDPYHSSQPGLRMRVQKCKGGWTHVCSIEDLCYISMRKDETVELSRQNGVPQYLQFHKTTQMYSCVSLLDGYYRLAEKWTFNLCKDMTTPSLLNLRSMKCHGPVDPQFAYKKLKEKSEGEAGTYLLRECAYIYNEFCLDILLPSDVDDEREPRTMKIYQDDEGAYALQSYDMAFSSIVQLISYHSRHNRLNLKRCIPPSEYDKSNLLLCRSVEQEKRSIVTRSDCKCVAQCIPHDALVYFDKAEHEFPGHFTIVRHALLKRSNTEFQDVAVKLLRKTTKVAHLQDYLVQCQRTLFLQHDALIKTVGVVLSPTAMVMEYLPMGRLDAYLRQYENRLKQVDLVEAAYNMARALWYLEEQQWCHGKIRCHNILVASHVDNSFKVKLADPGLIVYTDSDIHWIPRECFNDYSLASKSCAADVYAYGTTLWQIFSYGCTPLVNLTPKEAKEWYQKGNLLDFTPSAHQDIHKLIVECWSYDPDNRKRPQAIVRDLNQVLYEVYNSRRSHSYATIGPGTTPVLLDSLSSSDQPPMLPANRPTKDHGMSIFKSVIKWQLPGNGGNFPYNPLSQSTNNGSSGQSTCTILTDLGRESPVAPVNNLGSICEGDPNNTTPSNVQGDLSWVIDSEQLTFHGTLGQGFYGEVKRATLAHCKGLTFEEVAVKKIRMSNQSAECFTDLKREIEIMKNLRHQNIVEIKGLVEDPETMLVMEYVELGSLLAYLQMKKNKLGCSDLLKFAADVAEGMDYLERKHIVHRDLAARNILVASERHVKISDFGLAQFTEDHYYRMRTERNLPIRWYALESISEGKFSHKSDVWSYGITLWEMFSYGENPEIPGVPDTALNEALQQGQRLGITADCPALVYTLMRLCWEKDSHERPAFTEILQKLTQLQSELCS